MLEPFAHPLTLGAICDCGERTRSVGTLIASPPECACGKTMAWRRDFRWPRFNEAQARDLGILETTLVGLGLPAAGAMVIARGGAEPRYLLVGGEAR